LRRDVLGGLGSDHLEVAQERRVAVPPKDRKCGLIPLLRRRQDGWKVLTDHSSRLASDAAARSGITVSTPDWLRRCRRLGAPGGAEAGCNSYPVPGACPAIAQVCLRAEASSVPCFSAC